MTHELEEHTEHDVGFPPEPTLTAEQDALILRTAARRVVRAVLRRPGEKTSAMLGELGDAPVYGAFCTLRRKGELRACCGAIGEKMTLAEALDHAARRAATDDPRFRPIAPEELGQIEMDVWLLWGVRAMAERGEDRVKAVEIGRHGLIVEAARGRGLLLPGVAIEHHLSARSFLEHTCLKAGLAKDAWLDDNTDVSLFEGRAIEGRLCDAAGMERAEAPAIELRPAAVAGAFYPGSAEGVRAMLDAFFAEAQGEGAVPEPWAGAMVPHAGWVYSGAIAAGVFARLRIPGTVICLCPKHRPGGAMWAVAPHKRWAIPGGEVASDCELARALSEAIPGLELDETPHRHEHAIEVQLPMIARVAPQARVVGITIGGGDLANLLWFGQRLAGVVRTLPERPLLLISSDMNHFASDKETRKLDAMALEAIESLDPSRLYETIDRHEISMCGVMPAIIVLEALRELGVLTRCRRTGYATSADVSGDTSRAVGYAGMLFA